MTDEAAAGKKRKRKVDDNTNTEPKAFKPSQEDDGLAVELSNSRQVRVSKFKGTVYVNIREWYDKDGKLTPGDHRLSPRKQSSSHCNDGLLWDQ